ncbi:hypothetical protein FA95DRAFT_717743 [Auriscalpium vulgare]|uniref:Uncharacterized protein n=1 Tax=Auriscalpium vulgare TaxID=40419 RepID=A0ACB8SAT3_9AGAM|nr:hypothetical protein FA95DRAFT_717743 [Auriscalpium vulgare]
MASHASPHSDEPTESTSLLISHPHPRAAHRRRRPHIAPTVNRVRIHGLQVTDDDASFLPTLETRAEEVAFKLIVYLQLYLLGKRSAYDGTDVWEQWSKEQSAVLDAHALERRIVSLWEEFLNISRSTHEIEECLWSSFPLEEGKSRLVRVVDILRDQESPVSLLSHRVVLLSISHTWSFGHAVQPAHSPVARVLQICDSKATPRVIHATDTFIQLGYLALWAHYLLHPPTRPIITMQTAKAGVVGPREILLIIYSIASLCRSWNAYVVPCVLVSSAFILSLPSSPFPGDSSYSVLLVAFCVHIMLLHLPRTPSPNFILAPDVTLPLSTLLWYEFTRTLYPVVLFYLPAILVSTYFLSVALADSIPRFVVLPFTTASPMETREAFVLLWALIGFLVVSSTILLVLFSASMMATSPRPLSPWDRYSQPVGYQARRIFTTAVITYSAPNFFPPPFNLLDLFFIRLPTVILRIAGRKDLSFMNRTRIILWRCTVAPIGLVVAGCWLWAASLPLAPPMGQ